MQRMDRLLIIFVVLVSLVIPMPIAAAPVATPVTNPAESNQASPGATVTFAVIGDYGIDNANEAAVATMVNGWAPDFIITTGDDYYAGAGGGAGAQYDESTGKYYCNYLKDITTTGTNCPTGLASVNKFFPTLGNHDYSDVGNTSALPSVYTSYFTLPGSGFTNTSGNERYYDFVQGDVHFFMLNSANLEVSSNCTVAEEPDGCISTSTQANWLKTQLAASTSVWNIVVVHKAPYSSDTTHGNTTFLQWPFREWGADAVLAGHAHDYERIYTNGIPYFVNGIGGNTRYNKGTAVAGSQYWYGAEGAYWGAQKVIATPTSLTFEFYTTDGTLRDTLVVPKAPLAGNICQTVNLEATADTYINALATGTNYGTADPLIVDGENSDRSALLRWNLSSIPAGSTITDADLRVNITDSTDDSFEIYQLLRDWTETGATWNASGVSTWGTAGASNTTTDRSSTSLGTIVTNATGQQTTDLGTNGDTLVGGWVNGSTQNYGLIVLDYTAGANNEVQFNSRENATAANRPTLIVSYCRPWGIAWHDQNGNGLQEAGEPRMSGMTVNLRLASNDSLVATTTTDGMGQYIFAAPTNGTSYYVEFVAPASFIFSPQDQGGDDTIDSDVNQVTGRTATFTWQSATSNFVLDAGVNQVYIGDKVWLDANSNGQQDGGEAGVANVVVNLRDATSNLLVAADTTDASGLYVLSAPAGTYYVEFVAPALYGFTTPDVGSDLTDSDANQITGRTASFVWAANAAKLDLDAGLVTTCVTVSLQEGVSGYSGMVDNWINQGSTGTNNGAATTLEVIGGATDRRALMLWNLATVASGTRFVPSASVTLNHSNATIDFNYFYGMTQAWNETTSNWNNYQTGNAWPGGAGVYPGSRGTTLLGYLRPTDGATGTFTHELNAAGRRQIEQWIATSGDNKGFLVWNENESDNLIFASSENGTIANRPQLTFTHCAIPAWGNEVWSDFDGDGIQDSGEPPGQGVTINLWWVGPNGVQGGGDDVLVKTTQSVGGSSYHFDGLVSGQAYYVQAIAPPGYSLTLPNQGGDDSVDSDVDQVTGLSAPVTYTGTPIDNVDIGFSSGPQCFAVADSTDTLKNEAANDVTVKVDLLSGWAQYIGPADGSGGTTVATNIEASTYDPFNDVLYGLNALSFGTINTTNGRYTQIAADIGNCTSIVGGGTYDITDTDGVAINYVQSTPGNPPVVYGTVRSGGTTEDLLFQLNPTTGLIIPNGIGGSACAYIASPSGDPSLDNIDDIGFNPTGVLYGIANNDGTTNRLVTINTATGATVDLGLVYFGSIALQDIEGFSIDETGRAYFSTGQDGNDGQDDAIYEIDLTSSPIQTTRLANLNGYNVLANSPASPPYTSYEDYESLTCYGVSESGQVVTLGSIGNYVWVDENNDGYQDAGEDGIPNVLVELWVPGTDGVFGTADDTLFRSTYTDTQGGYLFGELLAGPYQVRIPASNFAANAALEGMTQTTNPVNGNTDFGNQTLAANGNGTSGYNVTLGFGQENLTADFGYNHQPNGNVNGNTGVGAIGDRVWVDANNNGRQDPDEIGIPGLTVHLLSPGVDGLFGTGDDPAPVVTTTDANGNYLFNNLAAGAYKVVIPTPPAGYTQTGDPDHFGTTGTNNDNQTTTPIILAPGDVFLNADFGYLPAANSTGSIGDHVWFDADADGVDDGGANEYGIAGVTVALVRDSNGNGQWDAGEPIIATDTTDASGNYLFSGLPLNDGDGDADYLVWVNDTNSVLQNLEVTYDADGLVNPTPGVVTGGGISAAAISPGTPNITNQDFGYTPRPDNDGTTTGLIGDTIFFDVDGVGGQGANEPGIEGVVVELYDSTGTVLLATTTTDENGHYYFNNLNANNVTYVVKVAASNFLPGGVLQGMNNTFDPDGGTANQSSTTLTLANPINLAQDFGYQGTSNPGSIGNLVWEDLNADGDVDTGEPGIAGVTVDLYRDLNGNGRVDPGEPLFATTTTDGTGAYSFTNLPTSDNGVGAAGSDWVVDVSDRAGLLAGYWHSLGATGVDNNSQIDPYAASISTASPNNTTADFGYYVKPAALGNFVWDDLDGDGIQDAGEPGIDGVKIEMRIEYGNGTIHSVFTVTGDDPSTVAVEQGWYSFGNLLLDEDNASSTTGTPTTSQPRYVIVSPPDVITVGATTYHLSAPNQGGNDMVDSDNAVGADETPAVAIQGRNDVSQNPTAGNESNPNAGFDFGYSIPMDMGDLPDTPYPTLVSSDGARHRLSTALKLGATADTEYNGQQSANALGDDNETPNYSLAGQVGDDEDGVVQVSKYGGGGWGTGLVSNNQGGGLYVTISGGSGVPQVFMDFGPPDTLTGLVLYYDNDANYNTPPILYPGTALPSGSYNFYFDIPTGTCSPNGSIPTRVRLSAAGGLAANGLAPDGEVEDYIFDCEDAPQMVVLESFEATALVDRIVLDWVTVSELNNLGFNIYRSSSETGELMLIGYVPSAVPGSTGGASYSFDDTTAVEGQTYWYWLEAVGISGATALYGPVSATIAVPTAVTVDGMAARSAPIIWIELAALLGLAALAFAYRQRRLGK